MSHSLSSKIGRLLVGLVILPWALTVAGRPQLATTGAGKTGSGGGAPLSPPSPVWVQGTQAFDGTQTNSSITATYSSNNTAGDMLVAAVTIYPAATASISGLSDSAGNSWTAVAPAQTISTLSGRSMQVFIVPSCVVGANTVTLTASAASALWLTIHEYSGFSGVAYTSAFTSGTASSTTITSASVTSTVANSLLFAVSFAYGGPTTQGSGFTLREQCGDSGAQEVATEDAVESATGSYTASFTNGNGSEGYGIWAVMIA
ncbi:MAG TPA: hypothetical protein VI756_08760 [Blastocatellia bacterium]